MSKLVKLFQPCRIGALELPNRLAMTAVTTRYDFEESRRLENFYAARARGGVGLIISGALQTIYPGRKTGAARVNIYDDHDIPRLKNLVAAIHENGGLAAAQLATYGYWSKKGRDGTAEYVGPSPFVMPRAGVHPLFALAEYLPPPRSLTIAEIRMIQQAIGEAAFRARSAGFDAVELQCVGGNIPHLFTNPVTNTRHDEYGGPVANRLRFISECLAEIRQKAGSDYPVICRIPGLDIVPWGLGLKDWQEMSVLLEKAGAHALHIYPRWYESRAPLPQMCVPRNAYVYLAEGIRQVVNIPVMTGVRINNPLDAEQIVATGKADLIGLGRPLIADPEWPDKARAGRLEDIRLCTACCRCYDDVVADKFMSCAVNPFAGHEGEYIVERTPEEKKVFVVGGGPAGMEAARLAAERGHRVTLFEAGARLGGQLLYAAIPPHKEEWNSTIQYLIHQLSQLPVQVKLNHRCTAADIEAGRPEVLIIATGARSLIPDWPGVHLDHVVTAPDALAGTASIGRNVVIVGGGSTGCETAEYLAAQGKQVTILEMLPRIGHQFGPMNRWVIIDRLIDAGVRLETGVKVEDITEKGVKVLRGGLYREFFEADSVVLALGMVSVGDPVPGLTGQKWSIQVIGDAAKPASVAEAIESGAKIALQI